MPSGSIAQESWRESWVHQWSTELVFGRHFKSSTRTQHENQWWLGSIASIKRTKQEINKAGFPVYGRQLQLSISFFFFLFKILFIHSWETHRERQRHKQREGLSPRTRGPRPEPKAEDQTLSHTSAPTTMFFQSFLLQTQKRKAELKF